MGRDQDTELTKLFSGIEEAEGEDHGSALVPEDRPRGILSKADREYLCGLKDYAHAQSEANRKQDIRERVENGLRDFLLLWWLLNPDERNQVFDNMGDELLTESFVSVVTFMYFGLDRDLTRFEQVIEDGIYIGANFDTSGRWAGEATDVDASIDIDYNPDVEELYSRLKEGNTDQLTPAEIGVLVRSGKLEESDLEELEQTDTPFPNVSIGRNRE